MAYAVKFLLIAVFAIVCLALLGLVIYGIVKLFYHIYKLFILKDLINEAE